MEINVIRTSVMQRIMIFPLKYYSFSFSILKRMLLKICSLWAGQSREGLRLHYGSKGQRSLPLKDRHS